MTGSRRCAIEAILRRLKTEADHLLRKENKMYNVNVNEDTKALIERLTGELGISEEELVEDILYGVVYGDWGHLEGKVSN